MENIFTEDQRLVILRFLTESNGHTANDSILDDVLDKYGHKISRSKVRAHIRWLQDLDLVTVQTVGDKTLVVTVTEYGADVAHGNTTVDGVKKPRPGEF